MPHIWVQRIKRFDMCFIYGAGLAAGMYSGLTYGLKEARGAHDWVRFLITLYRVNSRHKNY